LRAGRTSSGLLVGRLVSVEAIYAMTRVFPPPAVLDSQKKAVENLQWAECKTVKHVFVDNVWIGMVLIFLHLHLICPQLHVWRALSSGFFGEVLGVSSETKRMRPPFFAAGSQVQVKIEDGKDGYLRIKHR